MLKSMNKSRLITAGGTLACALGVGVLMQMSVPDAPAIETPKLQTAQVAVAPLLTQETEKPEPKVAHHGAGPVLDPGLATDGGVDLMTAAESDLPIVDNVVVTSKTMTGYAPQSGAPHKVEEPRELALEAITLTRADALPPATAPQPDPLPGVPVAVKASTRGDMQVTDLPTEDAAPAFSCEMEMNATPKEAALVNVRLTAPCMENERFTLHHNGMMITGATDDAGRWQADIPALSENALFIAAFTNGDGAVATADVPLLADYDRYVVQWKGYSGLQIHALEYGADYGQTGHVWHKEHRNPDVALRGEGGFILRLGKEGMDDALMAEVYSFPSGHAQRSGNVQVSLESEITQNNCGADVEAQALIKTADGSIGARDLKLAMPECNTVGDFIVLKNLYEDLKIAAN